MRGTPRFGHLPEEKRTRGWSGPPHWPPRCACSSAPQGNSMKTRLIRVLLSPVVLLLLIGFALFDFVCFFASMGQYLPVRFGSFLFGFLWAMGYNMTVNIVPKGADDLVQNRLCPRCKEPTMALQYIPYASIGYPFLRSWLMVADWQECYSCGAIVDLNGRISPISGATPPVKKRPPGHPH